ncbi:DUF4256 domain-containing protein [Aquiflexum sp. TKW24L]|uniref:DUF4256 domain-containing protein n=1 Tax=Aquiflexum sp. TKW24L TaxID=2942212 RepID=UPI0020BEADA1|nr:DUF4256 domain-containing protein [Aquiflexum sp. TKW24L]MCL6260639.1 DUF4256 domain-containing protein [Aquiflexum sp. TKW24L]
MDLKKELSADQCKVLFGILKSRFEKSKSRHPRLEWASVQARLESHLHSKGNPEKLWSLHQMETTGGEPDVVGFDEITGEFIFYDCSAESPKGRRSICFDREGLESRKDFPPANNAEDMAAEMGIDILTESEYRDLQQLGEFDTKTSSWIQTSDAIRKLGGALFCDRRYDHVFVYHNGSQSYYGVRAFRGMLRV